TKNVREARHLKLKKFSRRFG
ncbi:unnamed protein product, partial [Allacma fusca]